MRNYLDDLFYWLGTALICAGAYLVHPALALVLAGLACLVYSYLIGKARSRS